MNPLNILGVVVLGVAFGWLGGCMRGEHNGETERMALIALRDNAIASANVCGETLGRINEETTRGMREAEARAQRGEQAVTAAEKAAAQARAKAALATGALQAAKRQPTCRAQLEVELCPAIPLL